ncbi:MAG: MEKHLA domain-containing protein [Cyanobacteria bacterium P01_F01_bin.13]
MVEISNHSFLSNTFYTTHADLLCRSYERCIGQPLIPYESTSAESIDTLFAAPFALVSHGTETDPIFNFGNQTALALFELPWEQFTRLPSRKSAEPMNREERQRLLERVTQHEYINDYSGIRISASGKRFLIESATVWNLVDHFGHYRGQAAVFEHWLFL